MMYNATSTNIDVEEHLVPFPPDERAKEPIIVTGSSYSVRPAVACDTDSPKRDCSHCLSSSGVSSDNAHSPGLFRYGGRDKF